MDLLHSPPSAPPPTAHPTPPTPPNYDESKAGPDSLCRSSDLQEWKTRKIAKDWQNKRRAEIFEDFDREIYGRVPAHTPK